jgi:hypothetical protein
MFLKSYVHCYNYESSFVTVKFVSVKQTVAELFSFADGHYNKTLVIRFSGGLYLVVSQIQGVSPRINLNH